MIRAASPGSQAQTIAASGIGLPYVPCYYMPKKVAVPAIRPCRGDETDRHSCTAPLSGSAIIGNGGVVRQQEGLALGWLGEIATSTSNRLRRPRESWSHGHVIRRAVSRVVKACRCVCARRPAQPVR